MSNYDSSWDDDNEEAWDDLYEIWCKRDWGSWLLSNLSFPFKVKRDEDFNDYSPGYDNNEPFTLDHIFDVVGIEHDDEQYGVIAQAREGRRKGYVPLCDVEVTSKKNKNYWPVREYVVWFANR